MRPVAIAALLLASSLVALVPAAQASPPCDPENPCDPEPITPDCSKVPDRAPLLEVSTDCKVRVSVDVLTCPFGEEWVTNTYGPVTVRHTVCRQPPPPL